MEVLKIFGWIFGSVVGVCFAGAILDWLGSFLSNCMKSHYEMRLSDNKYKLQIEQSKEKQLELQIKVNLANKEDK